MVGRGTENRDRDTAVLSAAKGLAALPWLAIIRGRARSPLRAADERRAYPLKGGGYVGMVGRGTENRGRDTVVLSAAKGLAALPSVVAMMW